MTRVRNAARRLSPVRYNKSQSERPQFKTYAVGLAFDDEMAVLRRAAVYVNRPLARLG